MRKTVRIRGRDIPVVLLVIVIVCSGIGVTAALMSIGVIQVGYKITPTGAEAPTMTPGTLSLDLGSIPSGSSGIKEFSKVATLDLPVAYEITFTLDTTTVSNFNTFDVAVDLYDASTGYWEYSFYFYGTKLWNYDSEIVEAGTYDLTVKVEYTAVSVTSETTGTVLIDVSYPG